MALSSAHTYYLFPIPAVNSMSRNVTSLCLAMCAAGRGGRGAASGRGSRKQTQCTKGFSDPDYCNNRCRTDAAAYARASPLPISPGIIGPQPRSRSARCTPTLDSAEWPGRWEAITPHIASHDTSPNEGAAVQWSALSCRLERPSAPAFQRCLRGQRIVLVGDCMMRYQYLSLVHYLETGSWGPRV